MTPEWRLIMDGASDGALNMARDRAIQLSREAGDAPATLRLYRWRVPTVTIGRFQDVSGVDLAACERFGVDVVRRSTGGRAVLHDDELTYSLVASVSDGMPRGVAASYARISQALSRAYRSLGVATQLVRSDSADSSSSACYLTSTRADLVSEGAKISGSAQVWHGGTVLQHGSITRSRDVGMEASLFRLTHEEQEQLQNHTVTLESALTRVPTIEEIAEALVRAFSTTLGVSLRSMELSEQESSAALDLQAGFMVLPPV